MRIEELLLFVAVALLAAVLIVALVAPRLRGRAASLAAAARGDHDDAPAPPEVGESAAPSADDRPTLLCPSCFGAYADGSRFCPRDGRALVARTERPLVMSPQLGCRRCRRAFASGIRFCPFDGDPLAPTTAGHGPSEQHRGGPLATEPSSVVEGVAGKICPHCSRRYQTSATVCGRDGAMLVTVN